MLFEYPGPVCARTALASEFTDAVGLLRLERIWSWDRIDIMSRPDPAGKNCEEAHTVQWFQDRV